MSKPHYFDAGQPNLKASSGHDDLESYLDALEDLLETSLEQTRFESQEESPKNP